MPISANEPLRVRDTLLGTQGSHERLDIRNQGAFFSITVFVELVDAKYQ